VVVKHSREYRTPGHLAPRKEKIQVQCLPRVAKRSMVWKVASRRLATVVARPMQYWCPAVIPNICTRYQPKFATKRMELVWFIPVAPYWSIGHP
jgi:hypothetical protein